jgi:hypothetical protein
MSFDAALKPELARLFWDDPYLPHLDELFEAAQRGGNSSLARLAKAHEDRFFLESLGLGREALESTAEGPNSYRVGHEYDFLGREEPEWGLVRTLHYLKLSSTRPTKKVAVLTSIRNEGISILEWLAHYRVLGVDSIFVYTNANDDGSDELLAALARAGAITLVRNDTLLPTVESVQRKAYEHAFNFVADLWGHEWMFFIDADEFLLLKGEQAIGNLVKVIEVDAPHPGASGMYLNWKWFGSGARFHREPGLMIEEYTHSGPHKIGKMMARLRDGTGLSAHNHCPRVVTGCHFVDASLGRLGDSVLEVEPVYDVGQLNHYWNKSFEEFVVKNMRSNWNREPRQFFEWGNMGQGEHDPLPSGWAAKVQEEVDRLLELPGVREQSEMLEGKFRAIVDAIDRERDIKRMYEDARREVGL